MCPKTVLSTTQWPLLVMVYLKTLTLHLYIIVMDCFKIIYKCICVCVCVCVCVCTSVRTCETVTAYACDRCICMCSVLCVVSLACIYMFFSCLMRQATCHLGVSMSHKTCAWSALLCWILWFSLPISSFLYIICNWSKTPM